MRFHTLLRSSSLAEGGVEDAGGGVVSWGVLWGDGEWGGLRVEGGSKVAWWKGRRHA